MEQFLTTIGFGNGLPLIPLAILMMLIGGAAVVWPLLAGGDADDDVKRRLKVNPVNAPSSGEPAGKKQKSAVREKAMKTAQDFYAKTDPDNVARLRMKLIQAGYMEPSAVGNFFVIRFVTLAVFFVASLIIGHLFGSGSQASDKWILAVMSGAFGYFLPGLVLAQKVRKKNREYRNGFPDFMDLMIVCSDAGMTMEAGIERVSKEIAVSYPSLSEHLQLVSLELRAGRNLEDSLKSLGDRLCLDEVRSFATLLQQSKELGTSLSGALRVFSDEMRHKRMSLAEEKAHALPAKMSVPVTVCILPVVMMIAIIPVIVRFSVQ